MMIKSNCIEIDLNNLNIQLNSAQKDLKSRNQKWENLSFIAIILCCTIILNKKLHKAAKKLKHLIFHINNKINLKIKC